MELSSEVFTCTDVHYAKGDAPGALHSRYVAHWQILPPFNTIDGKFSQLTEGTICCAKHPAPKVGDTQTPAQMGFRKWGYIGSQT